MKKRIKLNLPRVAVLAIMLTQVPCGLIGRARADLVIRTFMLESVSPVARYGPFECRQGVAVDTAEGVFVLSCPSPETIEFLQVESGRTFGPFDFVEGRVVLIGDAAYTLAGFAQKVAPSSLPPLEPSLRRHAAPVATPSPEPVPQAIPERPVAPAPAGPASRVPPSGVPHVERPTPGGRGAQERSQVRDWLGPLRVGVGIGLLDSEQYELSLAGEDAVHETSIDRTTVSLTAAGKVVALSVGFVYEADVDGAIADSAGSVLNGEASDGTGWWIGLRGDWEVWRSRNWRIDVGASASYRVEDYALSYDAYIARDVSVVITNAVPEATSTEGETEVLETVTLWQYIRVGDDMTLTESAFFGNVRATYESPGSFAAYIGLRVLAYSKTDIDATLSGYRGDFDLDLERTGVVSATLGVSRKFGEVRWYADAVAGPDVQLMVGLTREF